jgi:secreted trypsin-like serine protease
LAHLGKHNLSISNEPGSRNSTLSEVVIHKDWNATAQKFDADIAIAVLMEAIEFDFNIQPACLPPQSGVNEEVLGNGTIVGWGKAQDDQDISATPNELKLPIVPAMHCYTRFPLLAQLGSSRTFCAGFADEDKGACIGDSGGGLYKLDSRYSYDLVGVISSSLQSYDRASICDISLYSIYTNVAMFANWIDEHIQQSAKIVWESVEWPCNDYE